MDTIKQLSIFDWTCLAILAYLIVDVIRVNIGLWKYKGN